VFHEKQVAAVEIIETMPGVKCWRKSIGIEKVGLYIPGGTAPLFSTILMLGIPAKIAGCKEVILVFAPGKDGKLHPAILFAAQLTGITKLFIRSVVYRRLQQWHMERKLFRRCIKYSAPVTNM
jgi:histidinol dehydrogenase